jgi:DNA processing protein
MDYQKRLKVSWLALNSIKGLGPVHIKELIEKFGSPLNVFESQGIDIIKQFAQIYSSDPLDITNIFEAAEKILENAELNKIKVITLDDEFYPPLLKEIYAPPPVLFVKGNIECFKNHACAVVGTRRPSQYGINATSYIVKQLVENKITIVSGLAIGIDTIAHKTCIENNGSTIAVLGCGIDTIYPSVNRHLAEKILEKGVLVSEFNPSAPVETYNFPRRNRIISGLSAGVLVVEAPLKSGSLITANYALQQGRDVFAVPGSIFSQTSIGTFNLLKAGAIPVKSAEDIIENIRHLNLGGLFSVKSSGIGNYSNLNNYFDLLSPDERLIFDSISNNPIRIDEISEKTKISVTELFNILLNLELKGLVKQLSGQHFVRT